MAHLKKGHVTERGFTRFDFQDADGRECSLQKSSTATEDMIRFGRDSGVHHEGICLARMHLTREQVAELLPLLQCFVKTGDLS